MIKFHFLTGDINWQIYGGKFISKKFNNGDFDYWLVLDVVNMQEATGKEDQPKYYINIQAVSPQAAGKKGIDAAFSSAGFSDDDLTERENDVICQVEELSNYGIFACLWQKEGDNLKKLLQEAHKEAQLINMLFGFYMDRPENGIGQDGWSLISGQDIREYFQMGK